MFRIKILNQISIFSDNGWDETEVLKIIVSLQKRGLIKSMEFNSFTRVHHAESEIKVVKQMPTIASNKQPTIAIVTAQYCEKVAVDSMLENKETFVRYTTVGWYQFLHRQLAWFLFKISCFLEFPLIFDVLIVFCKFSNFLSFSLKISRKNRKINKIMKPHEI